MFTNCTVDCKCGNVQLIHIMIEYLYNSKVSCLVDSACNSVPKTQCNFFKFWWDKNLKDLKGSLLMHMLYEKSMVAQPLVIFIILKDVPKLIISVP